MIARVRLALAVAAAATVTTCVFPDTGNGAPCESQSDCLSGKACVRIDESEADSDTVCLPMLELEAPQTCTDDDACAAAGFPIESFCDDQGLCACDDPAFLCDFEEVIGEHTCRCLKSGLLPDDACEDDNQCLTAQCGNGNCVEGIDGDGCDADEDCILSTGTTCDGGTCI